MAAPVLATHYIPARTVSWWEAGVWRGVNGAEGGWGGVAGTGGGGAVCVWGRSLCRGGGAEGGGSWYRGVGRLGGGVAGADGWGGGG